ncbi:MAG: hypothetical protein ACRDGT_14060 [Candidatus Limnocylindria bacterium]
MPVQRRLDGASEILERATVAAARTVNELGAGSGVVLHYRRA